MYLVQMKAVICRKTNCFPPKVILSRLILHKMQLMKTLKDVIELIHHRKLSHLHSSGHPHRFTHISLNFDVSSGTRQYIEHQLCEAAMSLEMFNRQGPLPATANAMPAVDDAIPAVDDAMPATANPISVEKSHSLPTDQNASASEYQCGPLSPGSMAPNMSKPGNMLDSAAKQLIRILHTI